MTESQLLGIVAALFGLIIGLLAWIGNRIFAKLDELGHSIADSSGELHDRITQLDRRVTTVETTCRLMHKGASHDSHA